MCSQRKPIALSLEAADKLYKKAKLKNKVLFCAFNRRHDPQLRKMHQSIKQGDIGELRMIKICSRDPPSHCNPAYMKLSGGIFLDSMVHDFDMITG
ncbi:myo-inositol 2-dehydrogenase-like isoform X1 [Liolophura sinensis]|uniref:myo-inositol 2-dehydrogenase-like isoform X1 n=1 Tax=Liolophura sinensis TaxID=3198878 RepID=UPI003159891D